MMRPVVGNMQRPFGPKLSSFILKTSYLPNATPSSADGKMEVAAQGDADKTLCQGASALGARGSDGQP
jgi:hypothetical protein